jgi:hypothetical protein
MNFRCNILAASAMIAAATSASAPGYPVDPQPVQTSGLRPRRHDMHFDLTNTSILLSTVICGAGPLQAAEEKGTKTMPQNVLAMKGENIRMVLTCR